MSYAKTSCTVCQALIPAPDWGFTGRLPSRCSVCAEAARKATDRRTSQTYRDARRKTYAPQPCLNCDALFTPKRNTARYCSDRCRAQAHRL